MQRLILLVALVTLIITLVEYGANIHEAFAQAMSAKE